MVNLKEVEFCATNTTNFWLGKEKRKVSYNDEFSRVSSEFDRNFFCSYPKNNECVQHLDWEH